MAVNQVNQPQKERKRSPLENFATVVGIGTNVADMTDKAGFDLKKFFAKGKK